MISPARSSSTHPVATASLVIVALLLCVLPKAALAQGLPMFPDPILVDYESALVGRAGTLHRVLKAATSDILDAVGELGLHDMSPEQMMQLENNEGLHMLERELQRQRLKFDRDEVCARAMMHLRLALSEAQAEYLP